MAFYKVFTKLSFGQLRVVSTAKLCQIFRFSKYLKEFSPWHLPARERERATSLRGEHQLLKMKSSFWAPTIFSSVFGHVLFLVNLAVFDCGLRFPISDSEKIDNLNAINDADDDEIQFTNQIFFDDI